MSRTVLPVDTGITIARFCLSPFGATVDTRNGGETAGNSLGNVFDDDVDGGKGGSGEAALSGGRRLPDMKPEGPADAVGCFA
jgi:hypothetical protein